MINTEKCLNKSSTLNTATFKGAVKQNNLPNFFLDKKPPLEAKI